MFELIVADEVLGLGVFSAAGSAEQEVDVWYCEEALGVGVLLSGKRATCDWLHPIAAIITKLLPQVG